MYQGYLTPHIDQIRDGYARGLSARAIATELYAAGARASTSDPSACELSVDHHITNLQCMALHVLGRLGLRARNSRVLDAKCGPGGVWELR